LIIAAIFRDRERAGEAPARFLIMSSYEIIYPGDCRLTLTVTVTAAGTSRASRAVPAALAATLLAAATLLRAGLFATILVLRVLLATLLAHVLATLALTALVLSTLSLVAHSTLAIDR
jgi:hypothetical protein